jgi:RNA 2',3'-cyclic 3'-phosphodiesterase
MSLVRAFIAIDIPSALQIAIDQQTESLRADADASLVRWVKSYNLHLTLKFLGDVSSTNIPFITHMLTTEAAKYEPFQIQVGKLGSFPTSKRPRVIWVGIQAPAALQELYRGIDSAATRLGYTSEARPFSPHLTIGRVRPNLPVTSVQRLQAALESHEIDGIGKADIDTVHLIKSDLRPEGSVYTRLFSTPLSK